MHLIIYEFLDFFHKVLHPLPGYSFLIYSKTNYASTYDKKSKEEKSDEKRVYYTAVTRAKDTLHILSTDFRFNYPIGKDYLIYLQEQ